ncbi:MAG: hypothetical protein K2H64_04105 [Desulfovibrio sp.]|nr:hypothetical protein [Desulfovibrio sp.]
MSRFIVIILIMAALLFPLTAAADGNVPDAAAAIGKELDNQLMQRFTGSSAGFNSSSQKSARANIMIMGTTAANINNLEQASGLARQMTEEISRWLVNRGYRYDEIRKGKAIRFDVRTGEFILTRRVPELASTIGKGQAILAGTYIVSGDDVRFTYSLISTNGNEVLAKASGTVPITPDLKPMLVENYGGGMSPTVYTRLR